MSRLRSPGRMWLGGSVIAAALLAATLPALSASAESDNASNVPSPTPGAAYLMNDRWTEWVTESSHEVGCSVFEVMTGRQHSGDENGSTRYRCSQVFDKYGGTPLGQIGQIPVREGITVKESNAEPVVCPEDEAFMTGRGHWGDENGNTTYTCATFSANDVAAWPGGMEFVPPVTESSHQVTCPYHEAMVGRLHANDENGRTWYACAPIMIK